MKVSHPSLGFDTSLSDANLLIIDNMNPHTSRNRMPRGRTKLHGTTILSMNDNLLKNTEHLAPIIYKFHHLKHKHILVQVSSIEKINAHVDSTSPQMSFDQMAVMSHQHYAVIANTAE